MVVLPIEDCNRSCTICLLFTFSRPQRLRRINKLRDTVQFDLLQSVRSTTWPGKSRADDEGRYLSGGGAPSHPLLQIVFPVRSLLPTLSPGLRPLRQAVLTLLLRHYGGKDAAITTQVRKSSPHCLLAKGLVITVSALW
jgi:hypothetical protein